MIRYSLLTSLIVVVFFGCCSDEFEKGFITYSGEVSFELNGETWQPFPTADDLSYDSLLLVLMHNYNDDDFKTYSLSIHQIDPMKLNEKQTIHKYVFSELDENKVSAEFAECLGDGDVAGDNFDVFEFEDNWIKITRWDEDSKKLEGEFQVNFIFRGLETGEPRKANTFPDTIRVTDGVFSTKVVEF